jgi:CPA2 family monovalent cation:H+ antiporter-2
VVGVLVAEDLIAILLMATLTAIASGAGLSASGVAATTAKLASFLVGLVAVGLLVVPRGVRLLNRLGRPETTLVASIGFCFGVSLLAHEFGYSVALGAFLAGSLIAESGEQQSIEELVRPVRDVFAAIFFVSVGLLIDPALIAQHGTAIAVLTGVVVIGKIAGVSVGAFLTGNGVRTSVRSGMSLAQIGEFSFIIAGLGLSLRATGDFLYAVAVAVSAITTLATPWLIGVSGTVADLVEERMPRPLQTFVALYGNWLERLRGAPREATRGATIRRLVRLLVLDVALLASVAIGTSVGSRPLAAFVERAFGADEDLARLAIAAAAAALALPLGAGVVRVARQLGLAIAHAALPAALDGKADLAAAPRRALVVTLQLAIVLLTGLPLLAVTQPFLGSGVGPLLFGALLAVLGFAFWRGTTELQGHVRAGARALLEALLRKGGGATDARAEGALGTADALRQVREILPGLGEPTSVRLDASSRAVGRSLADLNLRGSTGATVLAIARGDSGLLVPTADEILRAGDLLALAGTHEAVDAARKILESREGA